MELNRIKALAGVSLNEAIQLNEAHGDSCKKIVDDLMTTWKKYDEPSLKKAVAKAIKAAYQAGRVDAVSE